MYDNWAEVRRQLDQGLESEQAQRRARHRHQRRYWPYVGILAALALLVAALWLRPRIAGATHLTAADPVTAAWEKARAAGSYHFTSDIIQVTIPTAKITNVGRSSRTESLHLEGQNDLRNKRMEMRLWSDGGSILQGDNAVAVKVENGTTLVRHGTGAWEKMDNFTDAIAPQGDFMAYLAALRDVTAHPPERRNGIEFTRYRFQIDGPRFAVYIRDRLEAAMRAKGELPPRVHIDVPRYYRDMAGEGELWIGADGLPLRQILTLSFPEQRDETVNAQITVDFSNFAEPPVNPFTRLLSGDLNGLRDALPRDLPDLTGLFVLLPLLGALVLVIRYRRARSVQSALALAVTASMVAGPLLSTFQVASFVDTQTAKAAAQESLHEESQMARKLRTLSLDAAPAFSPHANPLAAAEQRAIARAQMAGLAASLNVPAAAPAAQLTDDGVDTDQDGLSDFVEERIGTDPTYSDSDEDLIADNLEVNGFELGGQTWYANPLDMDSNRDGLADTVEWDNDGDGEPDDTDGDGLPDLFDDDNDNDGVPDRKDLSPSSAVQPTGGFGESNPFQLTINNLTEDQPTFVDFQVRPQDEQHLWFAFNVLDWPQDSAGQVQDVDGKTYADLAVAQGRTAAANESAGDLKLLPMLEIRIRDTVTNLPPQTDLTAYNVSVRDYSADTKVAYVPLSIVTDEQTGQRVAFNGRVRYLPSGDWSTPHDVRLVWVIHALQDVPCEAGTDGCGADGYIHNVPQVVQSYYDPFTLTGLNVREEQGNASVAIIYEDPAVDGDKKDDAALWALSHGLDNSFLAARDQDNNGQRDVDLAEIERRFDRLSNSGVSETERWAIPNVLRVERQDYETFDQAMIFTAMTETKRILDSAFSIAWQDDNSIKPLLMYAYESQARALSLDGSLVGGYVAISNDGVVLDMAPASESPIAVEVTTGLKWTPYCAPAAASPLWDACAADEYWDELALRHATHALQPDDPNDPDIAAGRMTVTQLYALSLMQGVQRVVQQDNQLVSSRYTLKSDTEMEGYARLAGVVVGAGVPALANIAIMARFLTKGSVLKYLTQFMLASPIKAGKSVLNVFRTFTTGGHLNRLVGTGIVAASAALIAGAGVLAYYLSEGELGAKITLKVIIISITTFLSVISPILTVREIVTTFGGTPLGSLLLSRSEWVGNARAAGVIGAVIGVAITWGFFIYSMVSNNVSAFSPEFNQALAETIAATIYIVLLAALSATVIGGIIVGIVATIDAILTAVCELGVDELRTVPGLDGACFTLGTGAIKVIAYLIYNYDVMVDTGRSDLVVTGSPAVALADQNKGFVAGNELSIRLPTTTTVVHKDPSPANGLMIYLYLWLFSADNLRSSTVRFSLTAPNAQAITVARNQMANEWQDVREDHPYISLPPHPNTQGLRSSSDDLVLKSMYRGQSSPGALGPVSGFGLQPGLNRRTPFYLNMGYALPAYECWTIPNIIPPFFPPVIPVCYTRDLAGTDSTKIDQLQFDIFPATLDGFMTLAAKGDGGRGLGWDSTFSSLWDADGDGLRASIHGGLDPNDASPDSDGDGLTDAYELERRAAGVGYETGLRDTDSDGLTDLQEMQFGTDPAVADTDNDGLEDGEELWHQRYDPNSGAPTDTWEGGWDVTINSATPFTVRVSSDPKSADADGDGVGDQAERGLALDPDPARRVDNQNRPYHPGVFNTPPIAVYASLDDSDGFVRPGQSLSYTTTVVANTPLAPGVLNVAAPSVLGGSPTPYALPFDPLTFSTSQTVTQQTQLAVASGAAAQTVPIHSIVNTRLPASGTPSWSWEPVTEEAPFPTVAAPKLLRFTDVTTSRPERQDAYLFSALTSAPNVPFTGPDGGDILPAERGDILTYAAPGGQAHGVDDDTDALNVNDWNPARLDNRYLRGRSSPSVACNNSGSCMVVWDNYDFCSTVTINSITVETAGDDHGTSGIEPIIYLIRDSVDYTPNDGGYELLWGPSNNGGNDMGSGSTRGPNANGFPIERTFCGRMRLDVYELDGTASFSPDPSLTQWDQMELIDGTVNYPNTGSGNVTLRHLHGLHTVVLNLTFPPKQLHTVAGVLVNADGQVQRAQFPLMSQFVDASAELYRPVVASDGTNFLVAWELPSFRESGLVRWVEDNIVLRLFNGNGDAITQDEFILNSLDLEVLSGASQHRPYADLAIAWVGDRYRITRLLDPGSGVTVRDGTGQTVSSQRITKRDVGADGRYISFSSAQWADGADTLGTHDLAYDPVTNRTLLVYRAADGTVQGSVFAGNTRVAGPVNLSSGASGLRPRAAYHPQMQNWLVSWQDGNGVTQFAAWKSDLSGPAVAGTQPQFPSSLSSNALACPAGQSVPVVDLRFEELPGTTSFADSSGRGNNASCTGDSCPAAGVMGAPNAPLSDYALQWDGLNDSLTLNRTIQDNFTIAFWLKVSSSTAQQMLVDGGAGQANGFHIWLNNGALAVNVPGFNAQATGRVDDGQWHFIAVNRNKATGRVEAYVDGNGVIGVPGTANLTLDAAPDLRIGSDRSGSRVYTGAMDHLQIFPVVLSQTTVQAILNRTLQSYCIGGGADTDFNQVHWARLRLTQPDTRGGRISASDGLTLTIDTDAPSSRVTSQQNGATVAGNETLIIGGDASDPTSGVALVEVSVNDGPWQPASGTESWSFALQVTEGAYAIRTRATDVTGNVETPGAAITVRADATAPQVTLNAPPATPLLPTRNANLQWTVALSGTATDAGSGVAAQGVEVHLQGSAGEVQDHGWQPAALNGNNWTIVYSLASNLSEPTGVYTVTVRAADNAGNRTADNAASGSLRLDGTAPIATLSEDDTRRPVITDTLTLSGLVTDTNSVAGLDKLEIAFTPVEQVAAIPAGTTAAEAEALLNRTWHPVTLAQRGPGIATSSWSFSVPAGLEGEYQIDLRAADLLGNQQITASVWRGVIDNLAPRLAITATDTGASYLDTGSNAMRHAIHYICAAQDRNLSEPDFACPGEGLQPPVRSFDNAPVLASLFPDRTIRSGLAISYTLWETSTLPVAEVSACDSYGHCASASTPEAGAQQAAASEMAMAAEVGVAASGEPFAVIIHPTDGSFVAAGDALSVTVAAEASAGLKEVLIKLDDVTVQTLSFAQSAGVTQTMRTVNVPIASEGVHTLDAEATAWDDTGQTTFFPVAFTLDQSAPALTIDASALTLADTWQAQSGILRFNGTASDSVGLAAVQIREGNGDFTDATFGDGSWSVALPVADPEGRTLNITVRAVDRAGRITELTQAIATDLSAADAPDTHISSGPADPSPDNLANFVFTGTVGAVAFECQLDNGIYTPCNSPIEYTELSKGAHTFGVRAIDGRGSPDLSAAEYTWTVSAGQPDATIGDKPADPTTERTATFTFTGDATAVGFECSLDGSVYAGCTSPTSYTGLANGEHTFLVRARDSADVAGAADRYTWTVINAAPVADDQSVVVIPNEAEPVTLTGTDSDPLTFQIITPPAHGVLLGVAPNLTYVPDTGFGGVDSFTFRASDGLAESNLATVTLYVDNTPPVVTCSASPNRLWPPNHALIDIQASVTVTDLHSGPDGFTLLSVTSSEADAGLDDEDVPNDIQEFAPGTADTEGRLRAERVAREGRLYTLSYEGRNVADNAATCQTVVFVPHDAQQPVPTVVASSLGADSAAPDEFTQGVVESQNDSEPVTRITTDTTADVAEPILEGGESTTPDEITDVSTVETTNETTDETTDETDVSDPDGAMQTIHAFLPLATADAAGADDADDDDDEDGAVKSTEVATPTPHYLPLVAK